MERTAGQGVTLRRRELSTALLASATALVTDRGAAAQAASAPQFTQTVAEREAGVTPVDLSWLPGDPRRYGAALDGSTDDSAAMKRWAKVGGQLTFPVVATALVSAAIPLVSNTVISAAPGATIKTLTPDISLLTAQAQANIRIVGLSFRQTSAGTRGRVAHVEFSGCANCTVEECDFQGWQWAGVWLHNGCTNCGVRNNRFHDALGTLQDQSDVCVYEHCSSNIVEGNLLDGGGEHGILCQDPHSVGPLLPHKNLFANNRIGRHTGYGIAVYMPGQAAIFTAEISGSVLTVTAVEAGALAVGQAVVKRRVGVRYGYIVSLGTGSGGVGTYNLSQSGSVASAAMVAAVPADSFNKIIGNHIEDIQGSFSANTSSGAGIYVVGPGSGGTQVVANTIRNCCVRTQDRELAPAGIGISGNFMGMTRPLVASNVVTGMTQGDGILVVSCEAGCDLVGNKIDLPAANNGAGPGGVKLLGCGIRIDGSNLVVCADNDATVRGGGSSLLIHANSVSIADITVTGGYYESATGVTFSVDASEGRSTVNLTVNGVRASNTGAANHAFSLRMVAGAVLAGCVGTARGAAALDINNCRQLRVSGGSYTSASMPAVSVSGTNMGSFIDESVFWGTSPSSMSNKGSGLNVTWRSNAQPTTGAWQVGDTTRNTAPTAPGTLCWVYTAAGWTEVRIP